MSIDDLTARTVLGYTRVSKAEQRQGWSLEHQAKSIAEFATAKGLHLETVHSDAGRSGGSLSRRQGLASMLKRVEMGGVGAVVVWREDRFGRRVFLNTELSQFLISHGAALITLEPFVIDHGHLQPQGLDAKYIRPLMMAFAEGELDAIRKRIIPALEQAARAGRRGGRIPLGYQRVTADTVIIDEPMAEVVRRCFQRIVTGESVSRLVKTLAADNVHRTDGTCITADQLRWILRNPYYLGQFSYVLPNGLPHAGECVRHDRHHPAIIDEVTFLQVGEQLKQRRRRSTTTINASSGNAANARSAHTPVQWAARRRSATTIATLLAPRIKPLHGLLPPDVARCEACGGPMYASLQTCGGRGKRYRRAIYLCHRHHQLGPKACPQPPASTEKIDAVVVRRLRAALAEGFFADVVALPPSPSPLHLSALAQEQRDLVARRERLAEVVAINNTQEHGRLRARMAQMDEQLQAVSNRLRVESSAIISPLDPAALLQNHFLATWEPWSSVERRAALIQYVTKVTISDRSVSQIRWKTRAAAP